MPIPGNIPGNPGMEEFIPVFPGIAFPGNTRNPNNGDLCSCDKPITGYP